MVWNAARPVYRKLVWDGTRLVGGIMLGPIEDTTMLTDVGMLKGLIQSQVDLAEWKHYIHERPWDLRRAYVASKAASALLARTTVGAAVAVARLPLQRSRPEDDTEPASRRPRRHAAGRLRRSWRAPRRRGSTRTRSQSQGTAKH